MKALGNRLKNARENKGVTQTQVYKDTDINNKTLSGYERGVSEPDLHTIKMLADYYNVSLEYLLGKSDALSLKANRPHKMTQREKTDYDDFMEQAKIHFMGASSEDKDTIFKDLSELYFESKEINRKKFNPNKNK